MWYASAIMVNTYSPTHRMVIVCDIVSCIDMDILQPNNLLTIQALS